MSHIVVTGCAGFIGSHLTDRLLSDGHSVVGIDSFDDYYARTLKDANLEDARRQPRFSLHEANILDLTRVNAGEPSIDALLTDASGIYHLAAQAGVRSSWSSSFDRYTSNNVLATQQLLEACARVGVPKVVYASSSSVYGDQDHLPLQEDMTPRPRSPYGVTKLAAEHLCGLYHTNHGLDTVSTRFFTVYGPRQRPDMAFHRFIRAMADGQEITIYGDGTQSRDFTYIDDIIDGLVGAVEAPPGTVMNLGGGNRVGLSEAISTLGQVMGTEPRLVHQASEAGDVRDTLADVSRAEHLTHYRPRTTLQDGLKKEYQWFTTQRHAGLV